MSDEFDWDKEVSEWQSLQPDLPELKKNMRWLSFRMKLVLVLDVAILLLLIPFAFFIFQAEESLSVKVWFILVSIFAAIGVYFDFYLRRDLWEVPTTTKELYQHFIKRAKAGINIAKFAVVYLGIFAFLMGGWGAYVALYESARFERPNTLSSLLVGLGVVLVSIVISVWYGKRKREQLVDAERQYQEFIASDE